MPDFTCTECGAPFTLSQELIDRYPGWTPRFCRAHSKKKSSGASRSKATAKRKPRGGAGRSGSAREENLQLEEVLARYHTGPQDGIFTDGSCSPNPGPGGWGVAWLLGGALLDKRHGHEPDTTNNRMEMLALIEAMKMVSEETEITVFTDSQLCANTLNDWAHGWAKRGWKRKSGPIKNLDLVQEAFALKQARPKVTIEWIAAHSGHLGNELADSLATAWMRSAL